MAVVTRLLKAIFVLMTTLILVFGLCFALLGIALKYYINKVGNLPKEVSDDIGEYAKDVLPAKVYKQIYANNKDEFGESKIDFQPLVGSVSMATIVFGGLFIAAAVYGKICLCVKKWQMFNVHLLIWILISISYVCVIAGLPKRVEDKMGSMFQTYGGFTDLSITGVTWTGIMLYFKCCGMYSYRDFEELENWPNADLNGLYLFDPNAKDKLWHFAYAVEDLNKDLGYPSLVNISYRIDDVEAILNNTRGGGGSLTANQTAAKEAMEQLPVDIDFGHGTIRLNSSYFLTSLACCNWDTENRALTGKVGEGCNLQGIANPNTTNNSNPKLEKSCFRAISDFANSGGGYINVRGVLAMLAYSCFGFLVLYCIITALVTFDARTAGETTVVAPVKVKNTASPKMVSEYTQTSHVGSDNSSINDGGTLIE